MASRRVAGAGRPGAYRAAFRPSAVADGPHLLVSADVILVISVTHDHADRVGSSELLAQEWGRP